MNGKGRLTSDEESNLREDRVYAAITVLIAMGTDTEDATLSGWPGGLPAPTREELETAYRRLSQRLQNIDDANNPALANQSRLDVLDRNRNGGLQELLNRSFALFPYTSESN